MLQCMQLNYRSTYCERDNKTNNVFSRTHNLIPRVPSVCTPLSLFRINQLLGIIESKSPISLLKENIEH